MYEQSVELQSLLYRNNKVSGFTGCAAARVTAVDHAGRAAAEVFRVICARGHLLLLLLLSLACLLVRGLLQAPAHLAVSWAAS